MDGIQFITDLLNRYQLGYFGWVVDLIIIGITLSLFVTYVCIPTYEHIIKPIVNIINKISSTCDMILAISTEVADIKKELKTNGGSSVKDIVIKLTKDFDTMMNMEYKIISKDHAMLNMLGMHIDNGSLGFYETDDKGNCRFVSQKWVEMTGLTESESKDFGWLIGIHPDDRDDVQGEFTKSVLQGRTFSMRYRLHNIYTNKSTMVDGYGIPLYDQHNKMYSYIGSIREISNHEIANL